MLTTTPQEFVDTARKALRTPWVHQGRVVPHGLDCIGLVLWTLRQRQITDYEPPPYPKDARWNEFVGYFRAHLEEVHVVGDMKQSDILVFRQGIFPCHCGILTAAGEDPWFIHSYLKRRRVVEERLIADWKREVVAVFKVPGLT